MELKRLHSDGTRKSSLVIALKRFVNDRTKKVPQS